MAGWAWGMVTGYEATGHVGSGREAEGCPAVLEQRRLLAERSDG